MMHHPQRHQIIMHRMPHNHRLIQAQRIHEQLRNVNCTDSKSLAVIPFTHVR